MKGRILYSYLTVLLCLIGLTNRGFAQTITTGRLSTTAICQSSGGNITVPFSTSGIFNNGNIFSVQLSDVTGAFPNSNPNVIGTLTAVNSGTITATIPKGTAIASAYRIRIVSSNPVKIGSNSLDAVMVYAPATPNVTNPDPYCEGVTAQPLSATASAGGTLKWYALNGTTSGTATVPDTKLIGPTSYSVSQVIGGCEGGRKEIIVTVNNTPAKPVASALQQACLGDSPKSLTAALGDGGTKLYWYVTTSGGTGNPLAPQPPTSSTGSTFYYVSQSQGNCESDRTTVEFKVNSLPNPPTAKPPSPYCQGATTDFLTATPSSGASLLWWGNSPSGGSSSTTPPKPDNQSSSTYYVSQIDANGCQSQTRTPISVTIVAKPSKPVVKGPPAVCSGTSVGSLTATASADYTLRWWGTSPVGGSFTPTPPSVSNSQSDTYYVSQVTKEGCESDRAGISVTIYSRPEPPTFPDPGTFCQNRKSRPLQANASSGSTLNWFDSNGGALPGAPSPPTDKTGPLVYLVSQTNTNNCESAAKTTIKVTINSVPIPPSTTSPGPYCEGVTASPLLANGLSLQWYGTNQTEGSASGIATIPLTSATYIGTTTYYVTQTVSGCESERIGIPVVVKDTPDLPITQGTSFCQNYPASSVSAIASKGATLNWWGENAAGGTRSDNPPSIPNNIDKTYTYYVSQTLDGCESGLGTPSGRAQVKAQVKTTPGAPSVSPLGLCNNGPTQKLSANGKNIKWYDSANNLINTVPEPPTNTVGDQLYKATQTSDEGCESTEKASLIVTIKPLPGPPGVSNLTYCQKQQDQPAQNVLPLSASGSNLKWYTTDNRELSSAPIPSIDNAGTQSYQVSQIVNNCEGGKAAIQVTVNTVSAPITPKPLVVYCVNDKASPLEAVGETGSQLKWIDPYGRVSSDTPTPPTLNTNVQPGGDPFYVYQIGTNGCYSPRATIKVVVTSPPTLALAAPTGTVNLGQRAPLQLKFTSSGPFSYTLTGGYTGTSLKTDTTISVLPRGNTIYQVVTVSNGCGVGLPGNPATAQINVIVPTVSTSSLAATTLCAGTSLSVPFTTNGQFNSGNIFRIEMVSSADTSKKYAIAATATSSPVTGILPLTLPGGRYLVRVKADNPEIAITGSNSPTQLTIRSTASATLTGAQTIYEGTPANLTLAFGGDGPWTATYVDSLRTYTATTSTSPYIIEVRPVRTTTYRLTNVSNTCGNGPISGTATITVAPLLGVDDNSLDPLVKTYPVPTQTILRVEVDLPLTHDPATLSLVDAEGRPILQQNTRKQLNELDLTAQPNGLYFLRIQVGDRQTVRKVLKQ